MDFCLCPSCILSVNQTDKEKTYCLKSVQKITSQLAAHLRGNKKDAIFDERYVKYQNKGLKENEEGIQG